ncbi:MAG: asparagine synthase (glutamine-hydrolyzing), partial [Planctomycetes bacterium]|nr:asparagine synthase (glutamine-hydrolyzing) [Planctomycetota bacterium]
DAGYVLFNVKSGGSAGESRWQEFTETDFLRRTPDLHMGSFDAVADTRSSYNLALGHRRLSIIDLSPAGHQPMANRKKTIWITYNGEIYNYQELRTGLIKKGYEFFSNTDTEVIIYLYKEFGEDCVKKLNGIFAFAIWDGRPGQNKLFLARDRCGAKPLYYTVAQNNFIFASEIKAILEVEGVSRKLNSAALVEYFTFQNTFGETTLFENIKLLDAGHTLTVQGENIIKKQYWDFEFTEEKDRGEKYYADRLQDIFKAAIKRQLMSDVPVGSYLSGGMDSGSITALAALNIPRLMTFTGGFDLTNVSGFEAHFDERRDAELMATTFKTEHYQMVIHAGDFEWALPRVVWHIEDLRVGMCYPSYYIARLASKFVKVVLGGAGGDEIFGGYPWRYRFAQKCKDHDEFNTNYYQYWQRLIKDQDKADFFTPEMMKSTSNYSSFDKFKSISDQTVSLKQPMKKAMYFEAKTFLHGLLVLEDKLSMAHSLESRVPLLDNELIDFMMAMPTKYLVNHDWAEKHWAGDENMAGKYIFKKSLTEVLPESIINKRKQGFSAPEQSWYKRQLTEYVEDILLDKLTLGRGYFQPKTIRKIVKEHMEDKVNHRLLIWSLLCFEWWQRIFIEGKKP